MKKVSENMLTQWKKIKNWLTASGFQPLLPSWSSSVLHIVQQFKTVRQAASTQMINIFSLCLLFLPLWETKESSFDVFRKKKTF